MQSFYSLFFLSETAVQEKKLILGLASLQEETECSLFSALGGNARLNQLEKTLQSICCAPRPMPAPIEGEEPAFIEYLLWPGIPQVLSHPFLIPSL